MFKLEGGVLTDSSTSRSCLRSRSSPGTRRKSPAPAAVPVERLVFIGLVRPVMVRPVAGVWESVDSRPVPPTFFFGAALTVFLAAVRGAGLLALARRELLERVGRLALRAADRFFGADALLAWPLTAFFFCVCAFRTGFLAIRDSLSDEQRRLTERP